MDTKILLKKLDEIFSETINEISDLKQDHFFYKAKPEKWSIAEQIHHLSLSILPINNLILKPKLVIERWGHSNRKSRELELFLKDYEKATSEQEWKAFPPFVPKAENESENYAELHYTNNKNKIDAFYNLTGKQIEFLRDKFQITESGMKKDIIKTFVEQSRLMLSISRQIDDIQMDNIQLPLPYIGLVTYKEILYFTLNHTKHHYNTIKSLSKEKI